MATGDRTRLNSRWRRAGFALAAAIAICAGSPCFADPSEFEPQAAVPDPDYLAGKKAIEAKNWDAAIKPLSSAALRDPDNADIHNYLGYAFRKSGKLDLAFKHYQRALELNPRHRGAHEYIGEAFLMAGDLASAQKHLEALRAICLLPCEELADLERGIAAYRTRSGAARPR